jgi:N6-L-threonylcarbamoyladenine synthase
MAKAALAQDWATEVEPFLEEIETSPTPIVTLGIETSCDETSVAVLSGERDVLANVISSQAHLHEKYGGVVPELASRAHVEAVNPALAEALQTADLTFWDVDVVAVTVGPGLVGSLMVGVAAAKSLASVLEVPLVGVNHLEAHLYACMLEHQDAAFPAVGLLVSGGHTLLVHLRDHGIYEIVGQTLDDAAGEAFDKIARFLGLGFPGGPAIDKMATKGDPKSIRFPRAMKNEGYDFSFSGLKTAVVNHVKRADQEFPPRVEDICASFQEAAVEVQVRKTVAAAVDLGVTNVFLCGGVAANSRLREWLTEACKEAELKLFYPSTPLCTDNAAMVAYCGFQRYRRGIRTGLDVNPDPNLPLA